MRDRITKNIYVLLVGRPGTEILESAVRGLVTHLSQGKKCMLIDLK